MSCRPFLVPSVTLEAMHVDILAPGYGKTAPMCVCSLPLISGPAVDIPGARGRIEVLYKDVVMPLRNFDMLSTVEIDRRHMEAAFPGSVRV
jgi:hypothetical protein